MNWQKQKKGQQSMNLDIMIQTQQTKITEKSDPKSYSKVATYTSDEKKRKVTDTRNGYLQHKLLNNQTLTIITTTIDPQVDNRVATYGGTSHSIATPTTKGVITNAARSSACIIWTPGHVRRTGRESTTPCNCNVAVRSPCDNRTVMIGCIVVSPTMGHSGSQDILNKRQSKYPRVRRNTQQFDASVDGNLADDRDSKAIFSNVLGHKLSDSLSADIYL